jgi:hypothetical protein
MKNACNTLGGKPEKKRTLSRPRRRGENNIKIDLIGSRYEDVDWINLTRNRHHSWALTNTVMHLKVPLKTKNYLTSC